MTKEECLKALECLYDDDVFDGEVMKFVREGDNLSCVDVENAKKYYRDIIKKLIEKHFDNPPLQFSDLKIGEPYWDNLRECWLIIESYDPTFRSKEYSWYFDKNGQCYREELYEDEFEENRFYRKEVKDE